MNKHLRNAFIWTWVSGFFFGIALSSLVSRFVQ